MAKADTATKVEEAWNSIEEAAEKDDASIEEVCRSVLGDESYGTLMNVARSANKQFGSVDINTDAPKKNELLDAMAEVHITSGTPGDDAFYIEADGEVEEIDRLEVQTDQGGSGGSSEPSDKTVLYCLTRAETTEERVEEIREALEGAEYELRATANGDKFSIVLPAEESDEDPDEPSDDDEGSEEAESAEESEEVEGDDDEGDEEEAAEEADEPEDDDDDEKLDKATVTEHWEENKTKKEMYKMANELDISGRSSMTKSELIEAVAEAKPEVTDE